MNIARWLPDCTAAGSSACVSLYTGWYRKNGSYI